MEIIKIHYRVSKPVVSYKEIKEEAEKLLRFVERGSFKGFYNKAYAIAHCQVSETPYAFFCVDQQVVAEKMFVDRVIINPQIVEAPLYKFLKTKEEIEKANIPDGIKTANIKIPNGVEYQEPCMSFPYRKPKRVARYDYIKVTYQVPGVFGLKTIETELTGIASEIFQHEYDHMLGKNIYFESETPVKWWEMLGSAKSKGGESLDQFDVGEMKQAVEHERDTTTLNEQLHGERLS